jgi:hypothetical protein
MPLRGIVSTLPDPKYIAALEKIIEDLQARMSAQEEYTKNIGRAN